MCYGEAVTCKIYSETGWLRSPFHKCFAANAVIYELVECAVFSGQLTHSSVVAQLVFSSVDDLLFSEEKPRVFEIDNCRSISDFVSEGPLPVMLEYVNLKRCLNAVLNC